MEQEREIKTCTNCKQEKPFDDFYKNSSKSHGLSNWCKACHNEHSRKHEKLEHVKERRNLQRRLRPRIAKPNNTIKPRKSGDHGQVKGSIGEHLAAAALLLNGYKVYHQDHESGTADILATKDDFFYKIQVKTFYEKGNRQVVCLESRNKFKKESNTMYDDIDYFLISDVETCETFLVDSMQLQNRSSCNRKLIESLGVKLMPITQKT